MGIIQEFKCSSCHEIWKLRTGHGRMHATLKQVLKAFSPDIQKRILANINHEEEPLFHFNYCVAVCPKCKQLITVPVLTFFETGRTYISRCPNCNNIAEILKDDSNTICPKCQKVRLDMEELGHWD